MAEQDYGAGSKPVSGWAIGGTVFAGVIMILVDSFHAIAGLAAIIKDQFSVVTSGYTYKLDVTVLDVWIIWALSRPIEETA
jgi:hypothetical protein